MNVLFTSIHQSDQFIICSDKNKAIYDQLHPNPIFLHVRFASFSTMKGKQLHLLQNQCKKLHIFTCMQGFNLVTIMLMVQIDKLNEYL